MDHVWLAFVFRFNHRENFMKDLAKMANKRRWRWEKRCFGGKVLWNHIILRKKVLKCRIPMVKKKGPRPLVNTNDSWCCKWRGNCENAATRRFFERSLMDQCASLPGSLLAPVPSFWTHWGIRIKHIDRVDPYYSPKETKVKSINFIISVRLPCILQYFWGSPCIMNRA